MGRKLFYLLLSWMLPLAICSAEDNPTLTAEVTEASAGKGYQFELAVGLNNGDLLLNGYQFKVELPEALTLASNKEGEFYHTLGNRYTNNGNVQLAIENLGSGIFQVVCYSLTYETITGGEGNILSLGLKRSDPAASGDFVGKLSEIALSADDGASIQTADVPFNITVPEPVPITVTVTGASRLYGDENPSFEYTVEGGILFGEPVITCSATPTSPVGTYDIVIEAGTVENYNVTYVNGTLTVEKAPLTIKGGEYSMKQGDPVPELKAEYEGFKNDETAEVLTKQPELTCEATSTSIPGTYPVKVSGAEADNYEITYVDGILTLTEADPITVRVNSIARFYGDENPSFEYTVEGGTLKGAPVITCVATPASPVGTYDIVIEAGTVENFNVTYVNGTLTVEKAPLTIKGGEYTMKQGEELPAFTAVFEGFKNGETAEVLTKQPELTTEATSVSVPGTYPVKVSGAEAENYEISYVDGTLTIIQADPITIRVNSMARLYGDENPAFEYTVEGGTLIGTPVITCAATPTSPVGTYDIVIEAGTVENFNVIYVNGTLTVEKAPLTIKGGEYTMKQGEELPAFTAVFEGFKNGETAEVLTKQPELTTAATSVSAPGSYPVKVSGAEAENYEISYVDGTLIVTEADPIMVKVTNASRLYGDENPAFEFTVEGGTLIGTPAIACAATPTSPVGTYDIVIEAGTVENFNVTYVNGTLTVEKAPLTIKGGEYTMKQGDPVPELKAEYEGFKNGETAEVLTKQPVLTTDATSVSDLGTYSVKVSGAEAENYEISYVDGTLTIIEADAILVKVTNASRFYGDENPAFEYTVEGGTLIGTPAITCAATPTSPVGTYDIVIEAGTVENFNVTYVNGTLTVEKAPLTIKGGEYTMKQGDPVPELKAEYVGFKNGETAEVLTKQPVLTTDATSVSALGTYPVKVSGAEAENYEISYVDGTLTIIEADAILVKVTNASRLYGDENPAFEYTVEGGTLRGVPSITCAATPTSPVGTYDIVIAAGTVENFNVTYVNGTLTVEKAPLTIKGGEYTMKQGDPVPELKAEYEGFKNGETAEVLTKQPVLTTDATSVSALGTYPVKVSGAEAENYEISYVDGTLTIIEADAIMVKVTNASRLYGDENPAFEYTVEGGTLIGTPAITCAATPTSPVGTYDIVIAAGTVENFNVTYVNGTLTVEKAPLTIKGGEYTMKQGDPVPELKAEYVGFKNGETAEVLTKQPVLTTDATSVSALGTYPVKVSGAEAENYEISYVEGTLTIMEADPITVRVNSVARLYGDENPAFEFTVEGGTLRGVPSITCAATPTSPVGTYDIVIAAGTVENFNVTYVGGTLTVEKAPLTIKGGEYTMKQGDPVPELKAEYVGFKNGETAEVLTKQPVLTTDATSVSALGTYPVKVSGAEAENYEISYVEGTLTIMEADPITVRVNSVARLYGDENPVFDFSVEGGTLRGVPSITCAATPTSPVGTYDIVIEAGTVENFNVTYVNGTLTVEKAPLTIKGGEYTMKQGDPVPELKAEYVGFKNGETAEVLTKQPVLTTDATSVSALGTYPVKVSGAEAENYEISYVDGTLTIIEADAIMVKVTNASRLYGDENPVFDFSVEGGTLRGVPSITCAATPTSPVGTYDIVIAAGTVENFNVTYVNGTLTVEKTPLTIKGGEYTMKQGDPVPELKAEYVGFKNGETAEVLTKQPVLTTDATSVSALGTYPVKVSGAEAENYEISYVDGTLTIMEADPITVRVNSVARLYGDENPVFDFSVEGGTLRGVPSITCAATPTSPVGTYDIVIAAGTVENFNVTYVNGTLTVEKAPLTIKGGEYTMKQGDPVPELNAEYVGFKNGETAEVLTKQPVLTTDATSVSDLGTYPVKVSGAEAENYDITHVDGSITIIQADAIFVKVLNVSRLYGDENPQFEYTVYGGELRGTPEIICEATPTSPVGTYDILILAGTVENFNVTFENGTLTVEKASLTIKGGEYTMKQGDPLPEFQPEYEGFKNGETEKVLIEQPTLSTQATSSSAPGIYPIVVEGAIAENYSIIYKLGKLTITEADALVVRVVNCTRLYGEENPTFEYTVEGGEYKGEPKITCVATKESPVGDYTIEISEGDEKNYNVTYVNGTLTVEKAPLLAIVDDYVREYGEENPEFVIRYEGFVNGDSEEVIDVKPVATTSATIDSEPGEYEIVVSGGTAQNYAFSYQNGTLTIKEKSGIESIRIDHPVNVYTIQGTLVRHNTTSLHGLPRGIYIVEGRKVTVK